MQQSLCGMSGINVSMFRNPFHPNFCDMETFVFEELRLKHWLTWNNKDTKTLKWHKVWNDSGASVLYKIGSISCRWVGCFTCSCMYNSIELDSYPVVLNVFCPLTKQLLLSTAAVQREERRMDPQLLYPGWKSALGSACLLFKRKTVWYRKGVCHKL